MGPEQNRIEQNRKEQTEKNRTTTTVQNGIERIRIRIRIVVRWYSLSHQLVPVLFAQQIRVRSCNKTLLNQGMLQKSKRIQKFALLTKRCIGRETA